MKKCLRCNLAYNEQKFVQCPKCYPFSKDGTSVRCPKCGLTYLTSNFVCPHCGGARPPRNVRFCVHCAHQLLPGKTVCTRHHEETGLSAASKRRKANSPRSHFSALPYDSVYEISTFLPYQSNLKLSQVNRQTRRVLTNYYDYLHNTAVLLKETDPRIPPSHAGYRTQAVICGNYYVFLIDATPDLGPDWQFQDASPDVSPSEQISLWDMRTQTSREIKGSRLFCVLPGPQKLVTLCYQKRAPDFGFNSLFLLTYSLNRESDSPFCVRTRLDVSMDVDLINILLYPADNDRFVVYYITKNNITKKNTFHYQLYASNGLVLEKTFLDSSSIVYEKIKMARQLYLADGKRVTDYNSYNNMLLPGIASSGVRIVDVDNIKNGLFDMSALNILPKIPNARELLAVHNQYIAVECHPNDLKVWDCNNGNFAFPCTVKTARDVSINTTAMWEEGRSMYIVTTMDAGPSAPARIVIWNLTRNEPVCCLVNQDKSYFHALDDMTIEYDERLKFIIINCDIYVYVFQWNVSA